MVKYSEVSPEEAIEIQKEMTAIMEKYNCDMQVTSRIEILKRIEDDAEPTDTGEETTQAN